MLDYYKFDVEKFIKDYYDNKRALQSLKFQLEEITEIGALPINDICVQTQRSKSGLENTVIKRHFLQNAIKEYEEYFKTFDKAYNSLSEEDKLILDTFYRKGIKNAVTVLGARLYLQQTQIYHKKAEALKRFSKMVIG